MHHLRFLSELRAMLVEGPVALATVLQVDGSVPRRPGAMMALGRGRELGTVGGGAMEARILVAMRASAEGDATVGRESIDLGGRPDDVRDGICGGEMTIEVRRLTADDLGSIDLVISGLESGRAVVLVAGPDGLGAVLRGNEDDGTDGTDGGGLAPVPVVFTARDDGWRMRLQPRPVLLVVGGGHCGVALAQQASLLDFDVVIEDDREAVRAAIPPSPGLRVVAGPSHATLADLGPGREVYAALVTRSFQQDLNALGALRSAGAAYVGVMGSGRRLGTVFGQLRDAGWTPEELGRLDAPIGFDIGAETPAEIAVSITARLVERRAARARAAVAGTLA